MKILPTALPASLFIKEQFRLAIYFLILFTLLFGFIYPVTLTLLTQFIFPEKVNGSLITKDKKFIASTLLGQDFHSIYYCWGRPSATIPSYDPMHSSGSNLSPANPLLYQAVQQRIQKLKEGDPHNKAPIPIDLVTSSASGLDPHISIAAARYQAYRIAIARHINLSDVLSLIDSIAEQRQFGILGEPRLNVVNFNLQLDTLYPIHHEN